MKVRAFLIAIFGLFVLAVLFIKSKPPQDAVLQTPEKTMAKIINKDLYEVTAPSEKKSDDLDQTLLAKERFYTESEIENMTQSQFLSTLKDIERKLPKIDEIRKLPEGALHHTPALILEAGKEIGLIQEILDIHHEYETEALDFYERCVSNSTLPTPVRALCLTNLININNKNGVETAMKKYPQDLIDLAKMIIDI